MGYKVQKLTSRDLANKDSEQRRRKDNSKEVDQLWVRGAGSPRKDGKALRQIFNFKIMKGGILWLS
jgi:hypothetical protein